MSTLAIVTFGFIGLCLVWIASSIVWRKSLNISWWSIVVSIIVLLVFLLLFILSLIGGYTR